MRVRLNAEQIIFFLLLLVEMPKLLPVFFKEITAVFPGHFEDFANISPPICPNWFYLCPPPPPREG